MRKKHSNFNVLVRNILNFNSTTNNRLFESLNVESLFPLLKPLSISLINLKSSKSQLERYLSRCPNPLMHVYRILRPIFIAANIIKSLFKIVNATANIPIYQLEFGTKATPIKVLARFISYIRFQ